MDVCGSGSAPDIPTSRHPHTRTHTHTHAPDQIPARTLGRTRTHMRTPTHAPELLVELVGVVLHEQRAQQRLDGGVASRVRDALEPREQRQRLPHRQVLKHGVRLRAVPHAAPDLKTNKTMQALPNARLNDHCPRKAFPAERTCFTRRVLCCWLTHAD